MTSRKTYDYTEWTLQTIKTVSYTHLNKEGSGYMKKFSTEDITNIISNETNIWEQFKQNMKMWEKKLEVYGINIKLEQYWENNIYDPDEIFNERVEFRAGRCV